MPEAGQRAARPPRAGWPRWQRRVTLGLIIVYGVFTMSALVVCPRGRKPALCATWGPPLFVIGFAAILTLLAAMFLFAWLYGRQAAKVGVPADPAPQVTARAVEEE